MSRRRARYSSSRGPKNNVWSVVLIEDLVIDTIVTEADIVNAGDLQAAATGFQRFTLLRIRGWVSISKDVTSVVDSTLFMMIYATDNDAGVVDPSSAASYTDEDVLWTYGVKQEGYLAANTVSSSHTVQVDVKAMRKIDTSRNIRFAVVSSVAGLQRISAVFRGLTRKGGN